MRQALSRLALSLSLALIACASGFYTRHTPSGVACVDMPVIPAGTRIERAYHRLHPVRSEPREETEAQRLESLRKAACEAGADAVIEAVNEDSMTDGGAIVISSGTAVIWTAPAPAK